MELKKTAIVVCVSAAMISGAIGLSMRLTEAKEIEMEVAKPQNEAQGEEQTQTYGEGDTMPLYYDAEDTLLLPVRNVAQGLGGTVKWNKEDRNVTVHYKGKTLRLEAGSSRAQMCGYHITMDMAPQMINGSLYAKANILSDFFATEVRWDSAKKQISLKSMDGAMPLIASDFLRGESGGKKYEIEVPVIIGLDDGSYEKRLNKEIMQEMQGMAEAFLGAEGEGTLRLEKSFTSDAFLSLCWKGLQGEKPIYTTINIDLKEQKRKLLSDMLTEQGITALKEQNALGEASNYYITDKKELALLIVTENETTAVLFPAEGDLLAGKWQPKYQNLFSEVK